MQEIKTSYGKRKKQEDFKCLSMKETKAKPHMEKKEREKERAGSTKLKDEKRERS